VVICPERRAYCLRIVQLMPLHPKIPSSLASFKSRLVFLFLVPANQLVLEKRPLNGCRSRKGSPYSITEHRVPELIPVLSSQPAGDVSHKPDGRLPLLSARSAVILATLKRAATSFAAW